MVVPSGARRTTENEFARRFSAAIVARGSSLGSLQRELAARGKKVSAATLSYWGSGRSTPSRASSRAIVEELEDLLGVPPKHLTGALADPRGPSFQWPSARSSQIREAAAASDLPSLADQRLVSAHLQVLVDEDRVLRESTTTLVVTAQTDDAVGWASASDLDPDQDAVAEAVLGVRNGRTMQVDNGTMLFEFLYDPPLARGESRRSQHRIHFSGSSEEDYVSTGFGLTHGAALLVLTAEFLGDPPRRVHRRFTPSGDSAELELGELKASERVELVIPEPEVGLHTLHWEW